MGIRIEIEKTGHLCIERAGKMRPVYCPFNGDVVRAPVKCGDWCRLWLNPGTYLADCKGRSLKVEQLTDKRGGG